MRTCTDMRIKAGGKVFCPGGDSAPRQEGENGGLKVSAGMRQEGENGGFVSPCWHAAGREKRRFCQFLPACGDKIRVRKPEDRFRDENGRGQGQEEGFLLHLCVCTERRIQEDQVTVKQFVNVGPRFLPFRLDSSRLQAYNRERFPVLTGNQGENRSFRGSRKAAEWRVSWHC